MRVKIKNPRAVVYCPQQGKVVTGDKPVEVKYTEAIKDALRDGLLVEVQLTNAELKAREKAAAEAKKLEEEEAAEAKKLAEEVAAEAKKLVEEKAEAKKKAIEAAKKK